MDPNAAYSEMMALATQVATGEGASDGSLSDAALELAETVFALDAWMRNGGFPPSPWSKARAETASGRMQGGH